MVDENIAERLEPGMGEMSKGARDVPSATLPVLMSIAFSLKRIADSLDEVKDYTFNEPAIRTRAQ